MLGVSKKYITKFKYFCVYNINAPILGFCDFKSSYFVKNGSKDTKAWKSNQNRYWRPKCINVLYQYLLIGCMLACLIDNYCCSKQLCSLFLFTDLLGSKQNFQEENAMADHLKILNWASNLLSNCFPTCMMCSVAIWGS